MYALAETHVVCDVTTASESFHETGTIWVPLTFLRVFNLLGHQNLFLNIFLLIEMSPLIWFKHMTYILSIY